MNRTRDGEEAIIPEATISFLPSLDGSMWTVALSQVSGILVAQIGPFTALPTPEPSEVRDGQRAYFDQVNRSGGIRGRKITLFTSEVATRVDD